MIIIINKDGLRLCKDNRWRDFAMFGTYASCVKIYKLLGAAKTKARHISGKVVVIPDGMTIDASGRITETTQVEKDGELWDLHTHHSVSKFIV